MFGKFFIDGFLSLPRPFDVDDDFNFFNICFITYDNRGCSNRDNNIHSFKNDINNCVPAVNPNHAEFLPTPDVEFRNLSNKVNAAKKPDSKSKNNINNKNQNDDDDDILDRNSSKNKRDSSKSDDSSGTNLPLISFKIVKKVCLYLVPFLAVFKIL